MTEEKYELERRALIEWSEVVLNRRGVFLPKEAYEEYLQYCYENSKNHNEFFKVWCDFDGMEFLAEEILPKYINYKYIAQCITGGVSTASDRDEMDNRIGFGWPKYDKLFPNTSIRKAG